VLCHYGPEMSRLTWATSVSWVASSTFPSEEASLSSISGSFEFSLEGMALAVVSEQTTKLFCSQASQRLVLATAHRTRSLPVVRNPSYRQGRGNGWARTVCVDRGWWEGRREVLLSP